MGKSEENNSIAIKNIVKAKLGKQATPSKKLSGKEAEQLIAELQEVQIKLKTESKERKTLNRIILKTIETVNLNDRLEYVMDEALKITGLEGGAICLVNSDDTLNLAVYRGIVKEKTTDLSKNQIKIGECLCGSCAKKCKPIILTSKEEITKNPARDILRSQEICFHAAFPFLVAKRSVGVLCVFSRSDKKPSERKIKLLKTVVAQTAASIENASLYENLKESEMLYRSLFETAPDGILIADRESYYLNANASMCNMLGLTFNELIGLHAVDIVVPSEIKHIKPAIDEIVSKSEYFREWKFKRKDGSIFSADVNVSVMPDGNFMAMVRETTERKKAEEELRYHQELISEMGRVAKIGGWEFDAISGKGTWTEETARIHDLDPQEETNVEKGISFYSGDSLMRLEKAIKEAVEFGKSYDLELEITTAKGVNKWVKSIGHPLEKNGKVVKVRGSFQDITEHKLVEEELRNHRENLEELVKQRTSELELAKEKAESADRLKSAFLTTMSHELRTPLNSIIGFSGILMRERPGPLNSEQKKQLGIIQNSSRHLLTLINDVLDLSKIEAGQLKVYSEPFNLPEVIHKVAESQKTSCGQKKYFD